MLTTLKTVANSCYSALFLILLLAGVTACTPKGPKALLEGERLLQEGNPTEALVQLKTAAELMPQNAQVWNHIGLAYHQTGKLEQAAQAYNQALKLDRNLVAVRYNLGTLMLDHGDPARAVNEFKTFLLLNPESVEGHVQLGTAYLRLKQWNDAEASFATAQRLQKSNPEALNGLGLVLLQKQRVRDAVTYFNAALQQNSNFAPAHLNLAIIYHQQLTNYPLALAQYRAYLACKPTPDDAASVAAVAKQLEALVPGAQMTASAGPVSIASVAAAAYSAPTTPAKTVEAPKPAPVEVAAATPPKPVVEKPEPVVPAPTPVKPETPKTMAKAEPIRTQPKAATIKPTPTPPPPAPVVTAPPPPTTTATVSQPQPSAAKTAIPVTPAETNPVTASVTVAETAEPEEKPGFFQRINPLNLFRSKPKPPTPLDGSAQKTVKPVTVAKATPTPKPTPESEVPAPAPAPVVKAPPVIKPPPVPRYSYLKPGPFTEGDRSNAQIAFEKASAAQKARNWAEAIAGYRQAATADPSYFEAYYNLGWTAYEAKDLGLALVAYEHALAVQPGSFDARYNFALTLQQAGYPQDAADEFERLTKDSPNRAQPHLMLASLLSTRLHDKDGARQHYQKVLELEPNHPNATEIRYWLKANQ